MTEASDQTATISQLEHALRDGDAGRQTALLARLHPAQLADVLESFPRDLRIALWRCVPAEQAGEVLKESRAEVREQLIAETDRDTLAAAVACLDLDELADLHGELPEAVVETVLGSMAEQRRRRFDLVRAYADDTAGGLMDADAIAVRADVPLRVVLRYLRRLRRERGALPEHTDRLMVVDAEGCFRGTLALADLVSCPPEARVGEVMQEDTVSIAATTPANRVARLFEDHDLLSAAVVDGDRRLLGRITVDDVVDVLRGQVDRSLLGPAGLDEEADMFEPVATGARRRLVWLMVNLAQAFAAASVIATFEGAIEQIVALAVLMPVVASMGGVGGQQSFALVLRGLALEQVGRANAWRLLRKEVSVGVVTGLTSAALAGVVAVLWFGEVQLGLVFAAALALNVLNGVTVGTLVPLGLKRFGIDPAVAGGVLLTAMTDAVGFFALLALASAILL